MVMFNGQFQTIGQLNQNRRNQVSTGSLGMIQPIQQVGTAVKLGAPPNLPPLGAGRNPALGGFSPPPQQQPQAPQHANGLLGTHGVPLGAPPANPPAPAPQQPTGPPLAGAQLGLLQKLAAARDLPAAPTPGGAPGTQLQGGAGGPIFDTPPPGGKPSPTTPDGNPWDVPGSTFVPGTSSPNGLPRYNLPNGDYYELEGGVWKLVQPDPSPTPGPTPDPTPGPVAPPQQGGPGSSAGLPSGAGPAFIASLLSDPTRAFGRGQPPSIGNLTAFTPFRPFNTQSGFGASVASNPIGSNQGQVDPYAQLIAASRFGISPEEVVRQQASAGNPDSLLFGSSGGPF